MAMDTPGGQAHHGTSAAPDVVPLQSESEPVKDIDCCRLPSFQSPAAGGSEGVKEALKEVREASGYEQSSNASWETGAASQFELVGSNGKELSYAASSGKQAGGKPDTSGKEDANGKQYTGGKKDAGGKDESTLEKMKPGLQGLGILLMKIL